MRKRRTPSGSEEDRFKRPNGCIIVLPVCVRALRLRLQEKKNKNGSLMDRALCLDGNRNPKAKKFTRIETSYWLRMSGLCTFCIIHTRASRRSLA